MRRVVMTLLWVIVGGCAPADAKMKGELVRDASFQHDGEERTYHFYRSAHEGVRPLVVLLHGGGGSIDGHLGLGLARSPHEVWLQVADEEGLHLLVPQGLNAHWNDCRADCARCGSEDDLGFLLALIEDVAAREAVDGDRIYVTGESNGGFMTQRLALEAPERFAAAGVTIALMPADSDCTPRNEPIPILYQLGTADTAIPYEGGRSDPNISVLSAADTAAYWRGVNGCAETPAVRGLEDLDPDDDSTARRDDWACTSSELSMITLEGAGHVAPSIAVEVSAAWEAIVGRQNHDLESAREFWAFFEGKTRNR